MIHPTRVAGGPLAHFKIERPRSDMYTRCMHLCVYTLSRNCCLHMCAYMREVSRRVMLCPPDVSPNWTSIEESCFGPSSKYVEVKYLPTYLLRFCIRRIYSNVYMEKEGFYIDFEYSSSKFCDCKNLLVIRKLHIKIIKLRNTLNIF